MIRTGIEGLFEFGTHEHSLMGNIKNVGMAFMVMLIWTIIVTVALTTMAGVGTNEIRALLSAKMSIYSAVLPEAPKMSMAMLFFLTCVFAPLWEELAFRYVPLTLAKSMEVLMIRSLSHKNRQTRRNYELEYNCEQNLVYGNLKGTSFILPVMLLSSVIFGVIHGNVVNIMFQGVGGFIFAWLMMKGGYWPAVMAHFMWNFMLMIGMPIVLRL